MGGQVTTSKFIMTLPNELLVRIFRRIPLQDLLKVRLSVSRFKEVSEYVLKNQTHLRVVITAMAGERRRCFDHSHHIPDSKQITMFYHPNQTVRNGDVIRLLGRVKKLLPRVKFLEIDVGNNRVQLKTILEGWTQVECCVIQGWVLCKSSDRTFKSLKHLKVDRIIREALYSLPDLESFELGMSFLGFEGWLQRIKDSPAESKLTRISIGNRFSFQAFDVLPPSVEFLRMKCNFTNYKSLPTKLNLMTLDLSYGSSFRSQAMIQMTQFIREHKSSLRNLICRITKDVNEFNSLVQELHPEVSLDLYVNHHAWMPDLTNHSGLAPLKSVHLRKWFFEVQSLWTFLERLPRPRNLTLEIQVFWTFNANLVQQFLTRLADIQVQEVVLRVPQGYFDQHIWAAGLTQLPASHEVTLMPAVVQGLQEWHVKATRI